MLYNEASNTMQLILSVLYLISVIGALNWVVLAFTSPKRKKYQWIPLILLAGSLIQLFMSLELILQQMRQKEITVFSKILSDKPLFLYVLFLMLSLSLCIIALINFLMISSKEITKASVREAFDNLPNGICFIDSKGFPILVNRQMYRIVQELTGKDFQHLKEIIEFMEDKSGIPMIHKLSDKKIWQLYRYDMIIDSEPYVQIVASDITDIYNLSKELEEKNRSLKQQRKLQEQLLDNIVKLSREEEILSQKIYIHTEFGKAVLATKLHLKNSVNEKELVKLWEETLKKLKFATEDRSEDNSYEQLLDAAKALRCKVNLLGELPIDMDKRYLIVTSIREAVTNAVRHAKANEVKVSIRENEDSINVLISDNSLVPVERVVEGGGLRDLRRKIEKAGGELRVLCQPTVKLNITLKKE